MKSVLLALFCLPLIIYAQKKHTPLPHGMIFGTPPDRTNLLPAPQLEPFMGKRTRTTASVIGTVAQVTKPKGGWFEMDAGNGKIISAHFKTYNIDLPTDLKGRQVIIAGVASKQFIADDRQHLAGDNSSRQHQVQTNPKQRIEFEVTGLFVNK